MRMKTLINLDVKMPILKSVTCRAMIHRLSMPKCYLPIAEKAWHDFVCL